MRKYFKKILYFIAGYAAVLGLVSLINMASKCNILSSSSCNTLDAVQMVLLTPIAIPYAIFEDNKEKRRTSELQSNLREGVYQGHRESLESCVYDGCFLGPPINDPHPKETEQIKLLASEKLIAFDRHDAAPLEDIHQEYMIMAYWNLSQNEDQTTEKYRQYIHRAWQLLVEYNQNNEYKLNRFDYVITGVGGAAFLQNHHLMTLEYSDQQIRAVFDGCMLDPFWKQAKYESENADTEILHSCKDALSSYAYKKKLDDSFVKYFQTKWDAQWNEQLKKELSLNYCDFKRLDLSNN